MKDPYLSVSIIFYVQKGIMSCGSRRIGEDFVQKENDEEMWERLIQDKRIP